jgi:hypothetical protein
MSTARVDFTRGAAERIAAVVRQVEGGDRDGAPLRFRKVDDALSGSPLKLATFTADWQTGEYQVVTFWNVTSTPNTASVINLTTPSVGFTTANTSEERFVIYGKVKYTTDPAVVEIEQGGPCLVIGGVNLGALAGFDQSKIQILGHEAGEPGSACLKWFDITTCASSTAT